LRTEQKGGENGTSNGKGNKLPVAIPELSRNATKGIPYSN